MNGRHEHADVHFWNDGILEPPCGLGDDRFDWSDEVEHVTCEACREALAGDGGDLARTPLGDRPGAHPAP